MDHVQLVAAVDPHPAARQTVADSLQIEAWPDYQQLPGRVDAAVLAAPTSLHAEIALYLIKHGIHLLVEKPLAASSLDAQRMMLAAARQGVVLAVGHVERFNPAFVAVQHQVQHPRLIEAVRSGGFTFRCTDVGVVLDLMIHDLDLVLALVRSPVWRIDATGLAVVTDHEDLAQARIEFANGCVATLKASRTSPQAQRQMAIYEADQHVFVDFNQRSVQVLRRSSPLRDGTFRVADCQPAQIEALKSHVFDQLLPLSAVDVPADVNPLARRTGRFRRQCAAPSAPRACRPKRRIERCRWRKRSASRSSTPDNWNTATRPDPSDAPPDRAVTPPSLRPSATPRDSAL